jgi:hypothetical protein
MEVMPIDLTAVVGMILGTAIVLVPLIGFTARYALKPLAESLSRLKQSRESEESVRILERRMQLIEQQLEAMDTTMTRLAEAAEFHHELHSGAVPALGRGDPSSSSARDQAALTTSPAASPHPSGERRT